METTSFVRDDETGEMVFKPKYSYQTRLSTLIAPLMFLLSLWSAQNASKKDIGDIFFPVLFLIFTLLIPFIFIKEIRFGKQMVVKYFLIRRIIDYSEVKEISRNGIKLRGRGVSLAAVENATELRKAFPQLVKMIK